MTTKTEVWNSYDVKFVFDYAIISCCVFALHEDAAPDLAADLICNDLGLNGMLLDQAQDIVVNLLDEDVL
jgi:hypothetical protein